MGQRIAAATVFAVVCLLGLPACKKKAAPTVTERIMQATVFIRSAKGTGSGFVVREADDQQYLLTNNHVVDAPLGGEVEVTYYPGSRNAWTGTATLVASNRQRDLALLRTSGPRRLPAALTGSTQVRELMPVIVAGFPFGDRLSLDEHAPAASLSKASISALRSSTLGGLELLQLDTDINPGNSGGPVVNEAGEVVGITVAAVRGAGIGFVIPWAQAESLLAGRSAEVNTTFPANCADSCSARVEVSVIDPFGKTTRAELRTIVADELFLRAERKVPLREEGEVAALAARPASGSMTLLASVALSKGKRTFVQLGYEAGGTMQYELPFELASAEPARAEAAPAPRERPAEAAPPPAPSGASACWRVTQHHEGGGRFVGALRLTRSAGVSEGTVVWDSHPPGAVKAVFEGDEVRMTVSYASGLVGTYEARTEPSGAMTQGVTRGGGASARWSAAPVPCP